jgi:hypothetical protein
MFPDNTVYAVRGALNWFVVWHGRMHVTQFPAGTKTSIILDHLRRLNPELQISVWERDPELPVPDAKNGRAIFPTNSVTEADSAS